MSEGASGGGLLLPNCKYKYCRQMVSLECVWKMCESVNDVFGMPHKGINYRGTFFVVLNESSCV